MPVGLETVTFSASRRQRQDGIETIQGLNGGLLIDAEHGRVLGRVQIEAEDVGRFAFELGIVAGHVAFEAVRLEAGFLPNPMHGVFADAQYVSATRRKPRDGSTHWSCRKLASRCRRAVRESVHWAFARDDRCPVPRVRNAGSAASSEQWWAPWSGVVA